MDDLDAYGTWRFNEYYRNMDLVNKVIMFGVP
jgi:hypothetical protein